MSGVGVFGGTFDPVHVGHLAIANAALDELGLDRVYFVPARRSPLKQDGPIASAEDRLAMLSAAIADEGSNSGWNVVGPSNESRTRVAAGAGGGTGQAAVS